MHLVLEIKRKERTGNLVWRIVMWWCQESVIASSRWTCHTKIIGDEPGARGVTGEHTRIRTCHVIRIAVR